MKTFLIIPSLVLVIAMHACMTEAKWDQRSEILRQHAGKDIPTIMLYKKTPVKPLKFEFYDICPGDTVEAMFNLIAVNEDFKFKNHNRHGTSLHLYDKHGSKIPFSQEILIEKGAFKRFQVKVWVESVVNTKDTLSGNRNYFYYPSINVGRASFFESIFKVSHKQEVDYAQLSVVVYNNLFDRLLDEKRGKVVLKRSDCKNAEGLFLMFDASYGRSSVEVKIFQSERLIREKDIYTNDTIDLSYFPNGQFDVRYTYGRNMGGEGDFKVLIVD